MVLLALQLADDAAAACFVDGVLRCAVRDSVLTHQRPGPGFPSAALDAVLATSGVSSRQVTRVVATGLGEVGVSSRLRAWIGVLGGRRSEGEVRIRNRAAAHGPVSQAALSKALADSRLAHASVEIIAPALAMSHLQGRERGSLPLGLPTPGAASLALGAAFAADPTLRLPDDPFWAPGFTDIEAYRALSNAGLPRVKSPDPVAAVRAFLAAGESVVWASGRAAFGPLPLGPRLLLTPSSAALATDSRYVGPDFGSCTATLLLGPEGIPALTPVDVLRAWRAVGGRLVLGGWIV